MPAEGVVDALYRIHRALRPDGVLLDIHPEPMPTALAARTMDDIVPLGSVPERDRAGRVRQARAAIERLIGEGHFAREASATFDFVTHATSVDEWLDHRARKGRGGDLDPDLSARARELLAAGGGMFLARERVTAWCLRWQRPA